MTLFHREGFHAQTYEGKGRLKHQRHTSGLEKGCFFINERENEKSISRCINSFVHCGGCETKPGKIQSHSLLNNRAGKELKCYLAEYFFIIRETRQIQILTKYSLSDQRLAGEKS